MELPNKIRYCLSNTVNNYLKIRIDRIETSANNNLCNIHSISSLKDNRVYVTVDLCHGHESISVNGSNSRNFPVETVERSGLYSWIYNKVVVFPIKISELAEDSYLKFKAFLLFGKNRSDLTPIEIGNVDIRLFNQKTMRLVQKGRIFSMQSNDDRQTCNTSGNLDVINKFINNRRYYEDQGISNPFSLLKFIVEDEFQKSLEKINIPLSEDEWFVSERFHAMKSIYLDDILPNNIVILVEFDRFDVSVYFANGMIEDVDNCDKAATSNLWEDTSFLGSEEWRVLMQVIDMSFFTCLNISECMLIWKFRFFIAKRLLNFSVLVKALDIDDKNQIDSMKQIMVETMEDETKAYDTKSFFDDILDILEVLSNFKTYRFSWILEFVIYKIKGNEQLRDDSVFSRFLIQFAYLLRWPYLLGRNEEAFGCLFEEYIITRCSESMELSVSFYWICYNETKSIRMCRRDHSKDSRYFNPFDFLCVPECNCIHSCQCIMKCYESILCRFIETCKGNNVIYSNLRSHHAFTKDLNTLLDFSERESLSRTKRIERVRSAIREKKIFKYLENDFVILPTNCNRRIVRVDDEKTNIFKSQLLPIKLVFDTYDIRHSQENQLCEQRSVIYKSGDDLRQDQIVLTLIEICNMLFQEYCLDTHLVTYRVIPTDNNRGFIEYIESDTLESIFSQNDSISQYLSQLSNSNKQSTPKDNNPSYSEDIDPVVLKNYTSSMAGFCIITYLLGVGDRHLENLLIYNNPLPDNKNGSLFHVDFSYLFNIDPKPFPPQMRLCKEMIDIMKRLKIASVSDKHGNSEDVTLYDKFINLCFVSFIILRNNFKLILKCLSLSNIQAFVQRSNFTTNSMTSRSYHEFEMQIKMFVSLKMLEKMKIKCYNERINNDFPNEIRIIERRFSSLFPSEFFATSSSCSTQHDENLTQEKHIFRQFSSNTIMNNELDSLKDLKNIINESVDSLFPQVFEVIHRWIQIFRK